METGLTKKQRLLFLSFFIAQNSIWITALGWMATFLVSSGITPPNAYLLIAIVPAWGTILSLICQPIFAAFTDLSQSRWGKRRPFIFIGGLFAAFWFALIPLVPTYFWVIITYGLCSIFLNLGLVAYMGFYREKISEERRGLVSGLMLSFSIIAALPLLTGLFGLEFFGLPQFNAFPFYLAAIFAAILTLPTALFLHDQPATVNEGLRERLQFKVGLNEFLHNRELRRISIIALLYNIMSGMLIPFALLYLTQEIGITTGITGVFEALVLFITFMFCVPLGMYADRRGRRPLLIFASIIVLVGTMILFVNSITFKSFPLALVSFGFIGMGFTTYDMVPRMYIADIAPEGKEALYFAITNVFVSATFPVGIIFGGFSTTIFTTLRYLPVLIAIIAIILLIYVLLIHETAPRIIAQITVSDDALPEL